MKPFRYPFFDRERKHLAFRRLLLAAAAAIVVITLFTRLENHLLFYPDSHIEGTPDMAGLAYRDVFFSTQDGVRLHGWYIGPENGPPDACLLFFHGNAGNISHRLGNLAGLNAIGLATFIFDYRGYGLSQGRPDEAGLYLDGQAAFDYVTRELGVEPLGVILFGRSLGGAVAVETALNRPAGALIVESSFTSLRDVAGRHLPLVPSFLVSNRFNTLEKVKQLSIPALFIHGERDELVPFAMGKSLYENHPGPKRFYAVPGAGHNDTFEIGGADYYAEIRTFVMTRQTGDH